MLTIETVLPGAPAAVRILRRYTSEVASRWYGRPATEDEVDQALHDEPSDDLTGTTGVLLVALDDGGPVACAGARFRGDVAELTKVFTVGEARGRGIGRRMVRAAERACAERGVGTVQLDTRGELSEACALYERLGYRRVEPFNDEPYSDRWYRRSLAGTSA
ncbi:MULTISPECIES: GNAT family N-acetyltransferase [unclassified Curtobacterium]|uniref:GNAT family N-acetyltransferase n=1 Tax=unclassified Curtobacterium TaxID=257496 RepID=UPI00278889D3|nr:GNAT family N-acetyltransferase [Curtobacterium sp. 260]MDP9737483.1 GNAT superfamily N-acetyltransferase [Curtobacterium sp. 260]